MKTRNEFLEIHQRHAVLETCKKKMVETCPHRRSDARSKKTEFSMSSALSGPKKKNHPPCSPTQIPLPAKTCSSLMQISYRFSKLSKIGDHGTSSPTRHNFVQLVQRAIIIVHVHLGGLVDLRPTATPRAVSFSINSDSKRLELLRNSQHSANSMASLSMSFRRATRASASSERSPGPTTA